MRNQRGEGLISVLISVAILGILVVTVVTMYQMYGNMMAKSLMRREADNVINQIRGQLSRRTLCRSTLIGNNWDGVGPEDIVVKGPGGDVLAREGKKLAHGQLEMDKVVIRPFKIDADGSGTPKGVITRSGARVDGEAYRSQSGEIVIRFKVTGELAKEGSITERKAAVMVLVQAAAPYPIMDCDINQEMTIAKTCDNDHIYASRQSAANDGHGCAPGSEPHPGECQENFFIGAVDATGEPKCFCEWSCEMPYYQDRKAVSPQVCSNTSNITGYPCPAGAEFASPRTNCRGKTRPLAPGHKCYYKLNRPTICGATTPWLLWEATCMHQ